MLGVSSYAQDIITTKKGEDIKAKVLEITIQEVKYKKVENPDSPIYSLLKSDILMIRYENGSKDIFNEETKETQKIVEKQENSFKNRITIVGDDCFLNGVPISAGEMKQHLYKDEAAKELYKKAQRQRSGQIVCTVLGSVSVTVGATIFLVNTATYPERQDENLNILFYTAIPTVGFLIPTQILRSASNRNKAEAIETYNRNQERRVSITPTIGVGSVGLVMRF